ncbi:MULTISPECIES: Ig-like domain-containing protein [Photorhabdus]|uniref:Ig-like domain-containing protein n=1 Tax=Photorhabdus TaxID=29487 RepID=UPI000DCAFF57|nr:MULTISPECIES: Ig-like domain-containing protein [Photorhabdus]MCT8345303.1 Ig-like domain-containing protein [Photorhabdus kleinii]RAW93763.1 hypothetical protein CKY03_21815 [Photorhabdus sp. S9-53]RAW93778.1 hypothetical protein CKY05_21875 [Photorhabdus sp. S10-54]RAX05364.1 hypothetical protein CKY04_05720 [Photorhabdus sp. S8-52]
MNDEQAPKEAKKLNWVSSEKTETADKSIYIGIKVTQGGYLSHETNVTFTLDNEFMVFKENNDRTIIKSTGVMGKVSVEIISTDSTPCQGNVYACLEDDTQIKVPPLQVEFTAVPQFVASLELNREKNDAWANSNDKNIVIATAYDKSGNRIKNQKVTFNADSEATIYPSWGVTDKDGKISVSIRSDNVGEVTLTAQSGDIIKATIVCFTYNPYRLEITEYPPVIYSFDYGVVSGYLYKNDIGQPNIVISVSTGLFISLADDGKDIITDINGCFSFKIYSSYIGSSYRYEPPKMEYTAIGIGCLDDRIHSRVPITLNTLLY